MVDGQIRELIVITTLIFLIMPSFLLVYMFIYAKRKKKHQLEKLRMKEDFEQEMIKAQHEIQEQTMHTIGTDLHDNIGQLLSLTALTLKSINPVDTAMVLEKIDTSVELISKSMQEMRELGKLIQGSQLLELGINEAIKQEVQWMNKSGAYQVDYQSLSGIIPIKNPKKDLVLFRILQEILNNIIKHSRADSIKIHLGTTEKQLSLSVEDNGIGFRHDQEELAQKGMGLNNIHKRAKLIGGNVVFIDNEDKKGTLIVINIPYP